MSYATTIIKKLIDMENYHYSDVFGGYYPLKDYTDDLRETLEHIPEENLKNICDHFYEIAEPTGAHDCMEFVNRAATLGYLKFDPYVIKEPDGRAVLVLRWNRFVSLFRGYHYQVSYTFEGIGEYQSACVRTDSLFNKYRDIRDSRLMQILLYINCINACTGIDSFTETLNRNPEVIDDFVATTAKQYFRDYNIKYADVKKCLTDVTNKPDTKETPLAIFNMHKSMTADICRLHVYSTTVADVEFSNNGNYCRYRVILPDWREGLSERSDAICEDSAIYDEDVAADREILISLVCLALNSIGIVINYNVAYQVVKSDTFIKAINHNLVKELDSLDVIYGMEGLS